MLVKSIVFIFIVGLMKLAETQTQVSTEMQSTPDASENVDTTNDKVSSSGTGHMGPTTKSTSAAKFTATGTTPAASTEGGTTTLPSEGTTIMILRQTSIVQWLFAFTMSLYLIM
jgi:hypothetical protein